MRFIARHGVFAHQGEVNHSIGEPLDGFQGILRGVPIYIGECQPLLQEQSA